MEEDKDKIDKQIEAIKEEEKKEEKPIKEEAGVKLDVSTFDKTSEMATLEDEPKKELTPKKSNKWLWIVIGVLVVIILTIVLAVLMAPKNTGTDNKSKLSKVEQKEALEEYGEILEGLIGAYLEKSKVLLEYEDAIKLVKFDYKIECDEHEIYENGKLYLNKCSIDDALIDASYGKKQVKEQLKEGAIKVYVSKSTNKAVLEEPSNIDKYDVYSFDIEGQYRNLKLLGEKTDYVLYIDSDNKTHMYNYKTREKVLPNEDYSFVLALNNNGEYDQQYVAVNKNDKWGVYNISTGENVVPNIYNSFPINYNGEPSGPGVEIKLPDDGKLIACNNTCGVINYRTNKEIISFDYEAINKVKEVFVARDSNDILQIFDLYGKNLLNDKYDKVYGMGNSYFLVKDGNNIKILSLELEELFDFGKVEVGDYNYGLPYKKNGAIFQFNNPKADPESENGACLSLIYLSKDDAEIRSSVCGTVS